ncbi:MAG: T9SS type A sorting domain-containing protein, partial [Sphingobacteriales bacterium]|nr:T9SS type A sorting domain-containing protein [Sphingobacteriales bacterium]
IYDQNGQLSRAGDGIGAAVSGTIISFNLGFNPVTVTFDPFAQTLANGSMNLNSVLDVTITEFALQPGPAGNLLLFSFMDDRDNAGKPVLQKSRDGVVFTDAGIMEEERVTGTGKSFSYMDYHPWVPGTWYRVKLNTAEGEKFSRIIRTGQDRLTGFMLFPNPADQEVYIKWINPSGLSTEVMLIGMDGKRVWSEATNSGFMVLSTGEWPSGTYIVLVKQADTILVRRELVIRR